MHLFDWARNWARYSLVLLTAFITAPGQPAAAQAVSYETSWMGNTFGGANDGSVSTKSVSQDIQDMAVGPDGTCYTNTGWDEGGHAAGKYSATGDVLGSNHNLGDPNGVGIATDGSHIFLDYHAHNFDGIRSYNVDGTGPNWSSLAGVRSTGLAAANGSVFVTDFEDNRLIVLNAATGTVTGSFSVPSPVRVVVDLEGNLWITQKLSHFYCSNVIHRYTPTGTALPQVITLPQTSNPSGMCISAQGHLLVCDDGPDQNIKIYGNITTAPTLIKSFGAVGGIFSGVPGQAGPLKFNGPTAVGIDSNGNIYIAQDSYGPDWNDNGSVGAGCTLESYTGAGVRRWVLYGLEFTDSGNRDAVSESDIYSPFHHYNINYKTKVAGSEWAYDGFTMNRFKYPNDPRDFRDPNKIGGKVFPVSTWLREIDGKPILFWTGQYGGKIYFDHFNAQTDGLIAIPSPLRENAAKSDGTWAVWPDTNGTIWEADEGGPIFSTPCTGLDASGNPNWGPSQSVQAPSIWTGLERVQYYPATDTMYISGYTAAYPNATHDWGRSGFVIARYDNWSKGNRTEKYQIVTVTDGNPTENPKGFDVAGNYVFVSYWSPHHINVYNSSTGQFVANMLPGPEVGGAGNVGNVDCPYPIHAFQRPNGEYVILNEDNFQGKVVMYRWKSQ